MVKLFASAPNSSRPQRLRTILVCAITLTTFALASPSISVKGESGEVNDNMQVFIGAIFTNGGRGTTATATPRPTNTPTRVAATPTSTATLQPPLTGTLSANPCTTAGQSPQQQAMIKLLTTKPPQARKTLTCNPILMEQAMRKAKDMIQRQYYGHVDIDGLGMNYYLRQAGYPLPSYYLSNKDANNVEALAAGPDFSVADAAFQGYLNSAKHRPQILGLTAGWAAQDEYGVGYAYSANSKYGNYWVVLTAKNGD